MLSALAGVVLSLATGVSLQQPEPSHLIPLTTRSHGSCLWEGLDCDIHTPERRSLLQELASLEDSRPGLPGALALIPLGLATTVGASVAIAYWFFVPVASTVSGPLFFQVAWLAALYPGALFLPLGYLVFGLVLVVEIAVGLAVLAAAIYPLVRGIDRLLERGRVDRRTAELRRQLAELDAPPSSGLPAPEAMLELARF